MRVISTGAMQALSSAEADAYLAAPTSFGGVLAVDVTPPRIVFTRLSRLGRGHAKNAP